MSLLITEGLKNLALHFNALFSKNEVHNYTYEMYVFPDS